MVRKETFMCLHHTGANGSSTEPSCGRGLLYEHHWGAAAFKAMGWGALGGEIALQIKKSSV